MKGRTCLRGKTCLVTGSTSGIGQVTARALAEQGARVIIVGRNQAKCSATVSQIQQQTGNQAVEYLLADLSSQSAVRQLAEQFKSRCRQLHVLVNNNVLFTYELARHLAGTHVTVNALHPGLVATGFGANNGSLARLAMCLYGFVALSLEQGARTSIYLAASPEVEGITGKYFVDRRAVPSSPLSYDTAVAGRLWQVSAEMTGL